MQQIRKKTLFTNEPSKPDCTTRYLEAQGKAFTLSDHETSSQHGHKEPPLSGYVLAGVVFQKGSDNGGTQLEDVSERLRHVLTVSI
eukprot:scaffold257380_cov18-Tisochrysis_lutea.AAC.1